ncbi:RNA polymerase sigma factor [Congregicoccus parvus]|uniref:RNA polymerase sigma factor n=1 Tax=Congregicoccus parvus TaxID=3081749 RepID=UPI003FA561CF
MASLLRVNSAETLSHADEGPPMLEAELVRACLDGDQHAYAGIVRLHGRRVFNYIHQMTRQAQDAEDLTQQTFIKAYDSLDRFDTSRPLVPWLLTIARRCALNHFRSAKRWEEIDEQTTCNREDPAAQAERHDRVENLWDRARKDLSPREYEVMWLRFAEELSVEETARVTGLTRPHVKIIVFRARQRLMKTIALS